VWLYHGDILLSFFADTNLLSKRQKSPRNIEKFGGNLMFQFEPDHKKSETTAARKLGERIAQKYAVSYPVPVEEIIKQNYELEILEMELDPSIYAIVDLDMKEIVINSLIGLHRRRFTLAHELGHVALNHGIRRWTDYSSYLGGNSDKPIEEEANAFAAGLLMPGYMLKSAVAKIKNPKELAKQFQVSEQSMWISIETHRLINKLI
jgi:Zn-dependent peptidase ImmA (M78 family)